MTTIIESVQKHTYCMHLRVMNKSQATGVSKSITNTVYGRSTFEQCFRFAEINCRLFRLRKISSYIPEVSATIFQLLHASTIPHRCNLNCRY